MSQNKKITDLLPLKKYEAKVLSEFEHQTDDCEIVYKASDIENFLAKITKPENLNKLVKSMMFGSNTKLPYIFLKILTPHLSDKNFTRLMPTDLYLRDEYFKHGASVIYYSELKLLIVDWNAGYFSLLQFHLNSSDDINIKAYGYTPCLNP